MKTREELIKLGVINSGATQTALDTTRRSHSWHLGFAIGSLPPNHPMYCNIELAFAFMLATRSRPTQTSLEQLKAVKAEILAFKVGWVDAGRTPKEPEPKYVHSWVNHIHWNYDMIKSLPARMN